MRQTEGIDKTFNKKWLVEYIFFKFSAKNVSQIIQQIDPNERTFKSEMKENKKKSRTEKKTMEIANIELLWISKEKLLPQFPVYGVWSQHHISQRKAW